jgi:hypothetical protein
MQPDPHATSTTRKRRRSQISEEDRDQFILLTGSEYFHCVRVMSSLKYRIFMTGDFILFYSIRV